MTIVDTVFKALAPAIPDRVIAGHHADLLIAQFHGINPRTSEFFLGNFGPLAAAGAPSAETASPPPSASMTAVEDVRDDVRQGYVSVEEAAELYGVAVDPRTFEVDEAATAIMRGRPQRPMPARG